MGETMKEILFGYIWRYMVANGFILLGKADTPPTPDLVGAANVTAANNLESTKVAGAANRVNQVTPYGNLTYTQNPSTGSTFDQAGFDKATQAYQSQLAQQQAPSNNQMGGNGGFPSSKGVRPPNPNGLAAPNRADFTHAGNGLDTYTATQTLSPAEQNKLDQNNRLSSGLLDTAQLGLNGVHDKLAQGFDFNALPSAQVNAGQTGQDAMMARLTPQFGRDEDSLRTRLINQGLAPGSQAWNNEFTNFNNSKNDAYSQAALNGIGIGQQARQQALQEQEFGRTEGLNMVNALRTGNQVQSPNFVNTPLQATSAGADILGATNAQYQGQLASANAQNASSAGLFGGLATMGGSILGGPAGGALVNRFWGAK